MGENDRPAPEVANRTLDGRWRRLAWAHAALFGLLVLALRVERVVSLTDGFPGVATLVAFLAPEVGALLLFTAFALALPPFRGRYVLLLLVQAGAGLVLILTQSFLLKTGFRPPWEMAVYAVRNVGMLSGLLAVEVDPRLGWRAAGLAASLVLPVLIARLLPAAGRRRLPAWLPGAAGLLLLALPAPRSVSRAHLATNDVWALGRTALSAWRGGREELAEPAEALYRRPVLTGETEGRPPNIVLLILESTGADAVAPYASAAATPAMAAMAERGLVVETAYASVSHTSKALVGMLCGMMPRIEMDPWESLEGNLPLTCLPHLLAELGYRTAYLQSALGSFENRPGLVRNLGFSFSAYRETLQRPGFQRLGYFGLDDRAMAEPALGWIAGHRDEPYFMVLLTSATHHPYQTPGVTLAEAQADPRRAFERAVALEDELLDRLLTGLHGLGELERTVVMVVGDHGEAFGQHGLNHHDMVPYEEVVRVPWLVLGPEELVGPPRRIGGLRHHFDLLPTVLGLVGAPWEGEVLGLGLFDSDGNERVVSSCWFQGGCLAMREGDLKLVHHFGTRPPELFDLAADPAERSDLARTIEASRLHELEKRLLGFHASVDLFWEAQGLREGPRLWWARGTTVGDRPLGGGD